MKTYIKPFCKYKTMSSEAAMLAASNGTGDMVSGGTLAKPTNFSETENDNYNTITNKSVWDDEK